MALDKAITVTRANVVKVIAGTPNIPGITPSRRAFNLLYCVVKGRDVINRPDCPETGAFAQSLINTPDENRLPLAKALIAEFAKSHFIMPVQMNRLEGASLTGLNKVCRHMLSEDREGDSLTSTASD